MPILKNSIRIVPIHSHCIMLPLQSLQPSRTEKDKHIFPPFLHWLKTEVLEILTFINLWNKVKNVLASPKPENYQIATNNSRKRDVLSHLPEPQTPFKKSVCGGGKWGQGVRGKNNTGLDTVTRSSDRWNTIASLKSSKCANLHHLWATSTGLTLIIRSNAYTQWWLITTFLH